MIKAVLHACMVSLSLALVALSACATTRGFVRPIGPATPLVDRTAVWQAATAACRSVRAYRGELRLSGRVAGERVPSVTLGLAVDASGRLGFGTEFRLFRLGGTAT